MPTLAQDPEKTRESLRAFVSDFPLLDCLGVTLTLKQGDNGGRLDAIGAAQNLRQFLNCLNRERYGKAFTRFGTRLRVIPMLECSSSGRLHYHLALESPVPNNSLQAESLIRREWIKTRFGHREIHVSHEIDDGWIRYITKMPDAGDGIDWMNFNRD